MLGGRQPPFTGHYLTCSSLLVKKLWSYRWIQGLPEEIQLPSENVSVIELSPHLREEGPGGRNQSICSMSDPQHFHFTPVPVLYQTRSSSTSSHRSKSQRHLFYVRPVAVRLHWKLDLFCWKSYTSLHDFSCPVVMTSLIIHPYNDIIPYSDVNQPILKEKEKATDRIHHHSSSIHLH